MTDVVEIAKSRREKLSAEVTVLDDFIHMADTLLKQGLTDEGKAPETVIDPEGGNGRETGEDTTASVARRFAGHRRPSPTDADAPVAEHEDLSALELKADERLRATRTVLDERPSERRQGMSLFHRQPQ